MNFALKASVMLGLIATPMISMAASYGVQCTGAACLPFTQSNSTVLQLAVTTAQQRHALVGDHVYVFYYPAPGTLCEEKDIDFAVNHVPVLNSTNLTYQQTLCLVSDPNK